MSTLRISNIEAKSVPASATVDEKVKITNSSGDVLVFLDGKTSGITTVGINTTDANITFDANSNVLVTGIITATKFVGTIEPTNLTVGGDLTIPDKIIHTGDTNTAIRFPAADTISFETSGGERLRIDSRGDVYLSESTSLSSPYSAFHNLSIGNNLILNAYTGGNGGFAGMQHNAYLNSSGNWERVYNDHATSIGTDNGNFYFRNTGAGTGNISWSSPLTIASTGELTSTAAQANVATFTSNQTASTIYVKDTDGDGIFISGSSAYGHRIYTNTTEDLRLGTNSTERVVITSNGHTLFSGLTAHRDSTRNVNGITIKSTGGLSFQNYGSNGSRNWRMRPDDMSRWGDLDVSVSATANSATDWPGAAADKVITFGYDKTVTIPNGNLIMGSGYGIDFSATGNGSSSMSSELLDDYEEGSWTASVVGGNTITTNAAYYTKIGRMVYWHLHCKPTFAQNNTTVYNIYGLPYISANVTENYGWSANISYTQSGNSATLANMRPLVQMNNTYIYFHTVGLGDATRIKNNFIRSTMLNQDFLLGGFYMAAY